MQRPFVVHLRKGEIEMRNRLMCLVSLAMFGIAACGGGSGGGGGQAGGGSNLQYVGLTAPVVLTTSNYSNVTNEFVSNQTPPTQNIGGLAAAPATANAAVRSASTAVSSLRTRIRASASVRASATFPGNISGTITYDGTEPVLNSPYSYTVTFSNYADSSDTGGAVFNGTIYVSGLEDLSGTTYNLTETFTLANNFSISGLLPSIISGGGSFRMETVGSNAYSYGSGVNFTVSYTFVSERVVYLDTVIEYDGIYIMYENYDVYVDSYYSLSINGKAYYSPYGSVVVETVTPINSGSGLVYLYGTNGSSVRVVFGSGYCDAYLEVGDDVPPVYDDAWQRIYY